MEDALRRQELLRRHIRQTREEPRRVFLDTYAKRRAGHTTTHAAPASVASSIPKAIITATSPTPQPVQVVQPAAQAVEEKMPRLDTEFIRSSLDKFKQPVVVKQSIASTNIELPQIEEDFQPTEQLSYASASSDTINYVSTSHEGAAAADQTYLEAVVAKQPEVAPVVSAREFMSKLTEAIDEKTMAETEEIKAAMHPEKVQRLEANLDALYGKSLTEQIVKSKSSSSASHIRTIAASALLCGLLSVGIFAFVGKADTQPVIAQPVGAPVIEVETSAGQEATQPAPVAQPKTRAVVPGAVQPTDPVRVVAAKIGMNGRVERVGTNTEGAIDVPRSYGLVGWYSQGVTAGQPGATVLVGHFTGGYGGIFDKLDGLIDGDLITVTNGRGENFTYKVTKKAQYPKDQVPMAEVVKASDKSRLEIITCAGKWQSQDYTNRLVVTAEIVQ